MGSRVFQPFEPPDRRAARGSALALLGFVGLCLLVGASNGAVTAGSVRGWYAGLAAPPGTPPNWVFAPVWTVLYVLVGVSAWLVWRRVDVGIGRKRAALRLWGWHLLVNAAWSPVFFGLHQIGLALATIVLLLASVLLLILRFRPLQPAAALLLAPYAAWVTYATYLNAAFWWLNGG